MAFTTTFVDFAGQILENQYARIEWLTAHRDRLTVTVGIYSTNPPAPGEHPHTAVEYAMIPFSLKSDKGVWQQAYEGIKQWFPESVDC